MDGDDHDLLIEIHQMIKGSSEWQKKHDAQDDERYKEINKKLMYGAIAIVIIAFGTGVVPQVLASFKP